jgi:ferredoxin-NADP reductase
MSLGKRLLRKNLEFYQSVLKQVVLVLVTCTKGERTSETLTHIKSMLNDEGNHVYITLDNMLFDEYGGPSGWAKDHTQLERFDAVFVPDCTEMHNNIWNQERTGVRMKETRTLLSLIKNHGKLYIEPKPSTSLSSLIDELSGMFPMYHVNTSNGYVTIKK